jgi:uncharacterized membrane protein
MSDAILPAGSARTVNVKHVAAAVVGGALFGARARGRLGLFARLAGVALLAAAAEPLVERRVIGAGERRRSLALRESIEIDKPVSDVFEFFKNFENFARIIGAIHSVVDYEDGLSHWEAYTTSGELVSWDAVVTKYVPNSVIAWESVAGGPVESTGLIRFAPVSATRTRLNFELTYRAAPSGLGDAMRALVTPAPVEQLRADLEHARFYIESLPARVPDQHPA